MSFWKKSFWKKSKGKECDAENVNPQSVDDAEAKRKLRHQLSVSRSGRFKQKDKKRTGFLDQPELFNGPESEMQAKAAEIEQSNSQTQTGNGSFGRSQNPSHCREAEQRLAQNTSLTNQQTAQV
jgi:hypothetical protein